MRKPLVVVLAIAAMGLVTIPLQALAAPSAKERVQVMQVQTRSKIQAIRAQMPTARPAVVASKPQPVVAKAVPATTPAPTVVPAVASAPEPGGDIRSIVAEYFPQKTSVWLCIIQHESGFNPTAKNGQHYGLMQIATKVHAKRIAAMGYSKDQMLQVRPNLDVGRALSSNGTNLRPWEAQRGDCY